MDQRFFSKTFWSLWIVGVLFSFVLIVVTGGSVGSIILRLFINVILVTVFVCGGRFLWVHFLDTDSLGDGIVGEENLEEDEIILENDSNQMYNNGEGIKNSDGSSKASDLFSSYQFHTEGDNLNHLDSKNPYQMSDSLLRKFKADEEDSVAKFKATFQSPEEIAKAIRTELHKDS